MVNKKGYIKTLEAVIAIIMIIVISFTLVSQRIENQPEPPLKLQSAMKFINEKIELNDSLRKGIVDMQHGLRINIDSILSSLVNENKPRDYDFTCRLCSNITCFPERFPLEKNIYVSDLLITSSEKKQQPHIIRMWFWEQPTDHGQPFLNECQTK